MDMPVVATEDEISELPDGSMLFDADLDVMVKYDGIWRFWGVDYEDDDDEGTVMFPALLIHTGDAEPWYATITD